MTIHNLMWKMILGEQEINIWSFRQKKKKEYAIKKETNIIISEFELKTDHTIKADDLT